MESVGNWYCIVDEIEAAGCVPLMAHAAKAKVMMGNVNKIDQLDAAGLLTLLQTGTLPTVWLLPGAVRGQRELPRTRMVFCKQRTMLKNCITMTLEEQITALEQRIHECIQFTPQMPLLKSAGHWRAPGHRHGTGDWLCGTLSPCGSLRQLCCNGAQSA